MRSAPYSRLRAMLSAMQVAITHFGDNVAGRKLALDDIGPYQSRGKGRGGYQASKRCVAHDKRDARKARNRRRNKGQYK